MRRSGKHSRGRTLETVSILLAALGAIASFLVVSPARNRAMMDLSVGAREYGHWLGMLNLFSGLRLKIFRRDPGSAVRLLNLLSGVILLAPALWARVLASDLRRKSAEAFGNAAYVAEGKWFRASLLFRPVRDQPRGVKRRTLTYGEVEGRDLRLDLYTNEHARVRPPCVVVVPGGSWQHSDRHKFAALNGLLASRGYSVAVVQYRTAPESRFPAALQDVRRALAYLKENAADLGVSSRELMLLGRSAGAQLALLEAYESSDESIRGVISFYGPTDLAYAYAHPANPRVSNTRDLLEDYLGGAPEEKNAAYRASSPINFVNPGSPATLLVHGSCDDMVQPVHSERLASRLSELSVPHLFVKLPWATHGFDHNLHGPGGQLSTSAVLAFLAAVLGPVPR